MKAAICLIGVASWLVLATTSTAFQYGFQISNLVVNSPFQANASSTTNSSVSFDFLDQDTAAVPSTHCLSEWKVGLTPDLGTHACENRSYQFEIPSATYRGVQNFTINLRHNYRDDKMGEFPNNFNTKIGVVKLTFLETEYYECNLEQACCRSCDGMVLTANVTRAVAV